MCLLQSTAPKRQKEPLSRPSDGGDGRTADVTGGGHGGRGPEEETSGADVEGLAPPRPPRRQYTEARGGNMGLCLRDPLFHQHRTRGLGPPQASALAISLPVFFRPSLRRA